MILTVDAIADVALMSYRSLERHRTNARLIAGVTALVAKSMSLSLNNIGLTKKELLLSRKNWLLRN